MEFWRDARHYRYPGPCFLDHPRARVDHEERAIDLPNWLVRPLYKLVTPSTRPGGLGPPGLAYHRCVTARRPKLRVKRPTPRGTKPHLPTRLGLDPPLTAREVRELKARAAADLRTISNYVSYLVVEELKRKDRGRDPAGANPSEKRRPYSIALYLTAGERKRLEAAAQADRRSVSGYVARVIIREMTRS